MRRVWPALLALALAACEEEHPAIGQMTDHGSFGPAKLISLSPEFREDPEAYRAVGAKLCPQGKVCQVLFFAPGTDVPVPPPPDLVARRDGEYSTNPLTGEVHLALRCHFPTADPGNCL